MGRRAGGANNEKMKTKRRKQKSQGNVIECIKTISLHNCMVLHMYILFGGTITFIYSRDYPVQDPSLPASEKRDNHPSHHHFLTTAAGAFASPFYPKLRRPQMLFSRCFTPSYDDRRCFSFAFLNQVTTAAGAFVSRCVLPSCDSGRQHFP